MAYLLCMHFWQRFFRLARKITARVFLINALWVTRITHGEGVEEESVNIVGVTL